MIFSANVKTQLWINLKDISPIQNRNQYLRISKVWKSNLDRTMYETVVRKSTYLFETFIKNYNSYHMSFFCLEIISERFKL